MFHMQHLHNLLPAHLRAQNRVEYLVRFATLVCIGVACAGVAGFVALVPSLARVQFELNAAQEPHAATDEQSGGTESTLLAEGAAILALLVANKTEDTFMDLVQSAASDRPDGVRITGISYDRGNGTFAVEGVAPTRNALVSFVRMLEDDPHFVQVPDPLSDLARSTNLPFRLAFRATTSPQRAGPLP